MTTNSTRAPSTTAADEADPSAGHQPKPARADREEDGERRRHDPEVAGGEVHDPVGPVDERDAEREERGEPTDERALDDHAVGDVPRQPYERDDGDRRGRTPGPTR